MGGYGSGRRSSWGGGKTTTESQHRIDIRWMKQHGYLRPGTMGNLSWSSRGEQTGCIKYIMEVDRIGLDYRYRKNEGEWIPVRQDIYFARRPCNYGGNRIYFLCPNCNKRVVILYGAGRLFLCRNCYGLTYSSQQEAQIDRMMRKARKIRERLGADDNLFIPIWQKPKGMHEKTYLRLKRNADSASRRSSMFMLQRLKGTDCDLADDLEW